MSVELLPPGERPHLRVQAQFRWPALIDYQVHPVKVAVVEALRWVGGPLSAREIWLLGIGEPVYGTVAYHVKALVDLGFLKQSALSPARRTVEKFYVVLTPAT
jgi:hypothetical protein